MSDAETWADGHLKSFKQRMRINTEDPDELVNLTKMLIASYTSIFGWLVYLMLLTPKLRS